MEQVSMKQQHLQLQVIEYVQMLQIVILLLSIKQQPQQLQVIERVQL